MKDRTERFDKVVRIDEETTADLTFVVDWNKAKGYFEVAYTDDDGQWARSGGLWFKGNEVVDYDGVTDLPSSLKQFMRDNDFILNW